MIKDAVYVIANAMCRVGRVLTRDGPTSFSYICPGAVVAPDSVVPPLSIVAGIPARIVGELPTSAVRLLLDGTADELRAFQPQPSS